MVTSTVLRMLIGIAIAALTVGCGAEPDQPPPHILLISIDTLRADRLGCYGYPRDTSPALDALAASGWRFDQAFAHSNATGPSHMSLFTGVLPEVHGIWHDSETALSPGIPTITEQLSQAGWRTVAFADGGYVIGELGFDRGFDAFESAHEPFDEKLEDIGSWIDDADDQPTFLFVHTYGVHAPYIPAEQHDIFTNPAYRGEMRDRMEAVQARHDQPGDPGMGKLRAWFWRGSVEFNELDRQYLSDLYDGCIRTVDDGVARLLDMLDRKGWLDDTWIVITSDHGEAFMEHGTYSHRQIYQEELHVPLIIRPPGGLAEGVELDSVVGLVDVTATLLDIAGIDRPPMVQGSSLFPTEHLTPRTIRSTNNEAKGSHALTSANHKLLQRTGRGTEELFDRTLDSHEFHDLLADAETAHDVAELTATLRAEAERMRSEAAALRSRVGEPVPADALDPAQLETLKALGYVK